MASKLRRIHLEILKVFKNHGVGVFIALSGIDSALPADLREQTDLPRRIRELRSRGGYSIPCTKREKVSYYTLESLNQSERRADAEPISGKLRAKILLQANGRCQLCGKTIKDDGVKLVVDHRIPREWGGRTEEDNLWAIDETCNIQKRDHFAILPKDIMTRCMQYSDTTQRLGELLKVFKGKAPPRWLFTAVGMDDEWTRRLRELRDLGWEYKSVNKKGQKGANRFSYRLIESKPWPEDVRKAIGEAAKKRGSKSFGD